MPPPEGDDAPPQKRNSLFARLRDSTLLPLMLVLLIVAALYWPILSYRFTIIDDGVNVFHNPYISNPDSQRLGILWTHGYYALYMPLTQTIWALCAKIAPFRVAQPVPPGGANVSVLNPAVFHAASLLLHLGVVALVFGIIRRLRIAAWPSAVGALLYGVHPAQVQAVAWITGMNNLTGGFFGLLALWLYLYSIDSQATTRLSSAAISRVFYVFATLALVAALLCKPTASIIPVFAALFERFAYRRPIRKWAYRLGFWLVPTVICGVLNSIIARNDNSAVWSPIWGRFFIAGDSLAFGVAKLVYPFALTVDYGRSTHVVLGNWWGYVTWIAPAAAMLLYWRDRGRLSPRAQWITELSGLIFVVGLLPTLGFVPYYTQWVSSVADRYLYLAMLGPAIGASFLMSWAGSKRSFLLASTGVILAAFAIQTAQILPVWRNMDTLTDFMLATNPRSWTAHDNEGYICGGRGDLACALREFTAAGELEEPKTANNRFFLGVTLTEMGRFNDAVGPLSEAFHLNPSDNEIAYQFWNALAVLKRMDEAQGVLAKHLALSPNDARSQLNMGKMLVVQNRSAEALPYLVSAARLLPNEPSAHFFLGSALEQQHRLVDALAAYERAAALDPAQAEIRAAVERLAPRK